MNKNEIAEKVLGWPGRMISGSKSGYNSQHRNNVVVFNANVCVESGKIWHGDLDVTKDKEMLAKLAEQVDEPIYVLYEHDGRFEHEEKPLIDRHVIRFNPDGSNEFGKQYQEYHKTKSL